MDTFEVAARRNDERTDVLEIPLTPRVQPREDRSPVFSKILGKLPQELSRRSPVVRPRNLLELDRVEAGFRQRRSPGRRIGCRSPHWADLGHCPSVKRFARVQNNLAGLLIGRRVAGDGAFCEGTLRAKSIFRAQVRRRFLAAKKLNFAIHEHSH
jgi:hypothetical protein